MIKIRQSWDDLHRIQNRRDDQAYIGLDGNLVDGNLTRYSYDDLDRKVRTDYQDRTFETWTYNADSELLTRTNQNRSVEFWSHDADSRPLEVLIDHSQATATVLGTTRKAWGYDGLDRVTLATDNNGQGEDVAIFKLYDSLSRPIQELLVTVKIPFSQ